MRTSRPNPGCEDQTAVLRSALEATHQTAAKVQRELVEGLPPGEDPEAHLRRIRQALDGQAERQADSAMGATSSAPPNARACLERENLRAALQDEERVIQQAEDIVQRDGGAQETIDTLWAMETDWDPGEPLQRADRALKRRS